LPEEHAAAGRLPFAALLNLFHRETQAEGARLFLRFAGHKRSETGGVVGVSRCVEDGDAGRLSRRLGRLKAEDGSGEEGGAENSEEGQGNAVARKRYRGGKNGGAAGDDPSQVPTEGTGDGSQDPCCGQIS